MKHFFDLILPMTIGFVATTLFCGMSSMMFGPHPWLPMFQYGVFLTGGWILGISIMAFKEK